MEEHREKRRGRREVRLGLFGRRVTALLLGLAAALALLGLIARDRAFSDSENRTLAQRPAMTLAGLRDGSYFDALSDYLADQFWARDTWISIDTFGARLTGQREANGVFIGKKGYLFSPPDAPDDEIASRKLTAVNTFAQQYPEVRMRLMLAPGSAAVLGDLLPANAPVRAQLEDIDAATILVDPSVERLDVSAALLTHRDEDIYYRTDHHWTSLGAYYAFAAAATSLTNGAGVPSFSVLTVSDSFEGTLASRAGVHRAKDTIQIYMPQNTGVEYYVRYPDTNERVTSMYVSAALEEKDQYTVFFGGNHDLVEIWTTADNGRSLLVFKDSYANCFMQFLVPFYDKIIMIDPRYYYGDLSTVMTTYGITDVLYLYCADTWMTDTTLADVLETGEPMTVGDDGSVAHLVLGAAGGAD